MVLAAIAAGLYAAYGINLAPGKMRVIAKEAAFLAPAHEAEQLFPGLAGGLVATVEADDPVVARDAALRLAQAFRDRPDLYTDVFAPGIGPFYDQNALLLLSQPETEAVEQRLQRWMPLIEILNRQPDLVGLTIALEQLAIAAQMGIFPVEGATLLTEFDRVTQSLLDGKATSVDWQTVLAGDFNRNRQRWTINVRMTNDPGALASAQALIRDPAILGTGNARITLAGGQNGRTATLDVPPAWPWEAILAACAVAMVVLLVALRSFRLFVVGVVASATCIGLVLALMATVTGSVGMTAFILLIALIALSIDGPLQVILRYREARQAGHEMLDAISIAGGTCAPAILLFVLVLTGAFCAFWVTDIIGVARLTWLALPALVLMAAVTLVGVPALLALMPIESRARRVVRHPVLETIGQTLTSRPVRLIITVPVLAAAGASLVLLPRIEFDRDIDTGAALAGRPAAHVLVRSPDKLGEVISRLEALPEVAGVVSVATFIPSGQAGKLEVLKRIQAILPASSGITGQSAEAMAELDILQQLDLALEGIASSPAPEDAKAAARNFAGVLNTYRARNGDDVAALRDLSAVLIDGLQETTSRLETLADASRISLANLDPELKRRYVAPDGTLLVEVMASQPLSTKEALHAFVSAVQEVAPDATGPAIDEVQTGYFLKTSTLLALAVTGIAIGLLLLVTLPRPYDVVLVSIPIAFAALILVGGAAVAGLKIVPIALVALPILIGIGVGNGVKIVLRAREGGRFHAVVQPSTPRAALWSMLAVIFAAAVLIAGPLAEFQMVGIFLAAGCGLLLLCIFLVLPTLVELTAEKGRRGGSISRARNATVRQQPFND